MLAGVCACVCACVRLCVCTRKIKSQSRCRQATSRHTQPTFGILPIDHSRTGSPVCTSHIFTSPAVSADAIISRPCPSTALAAVTRITGCECTAGSTDRKGTRVSYIRTCTSASPHSYENGCDLRVTDSVKEWGSAALINLLHALVRLKRGYQETTYFAWVQE